MRLIPPRASKIGEILKFLRWMSEFKPLSCLWNLDLFSVVIIGLIAILRVYLSNKYGHDPNYQKNLTLSPNNWIECVMPVYKSKAVKPKLHSSIEILLHKKPRIDKCWNWINLRTDYLYRQFRDLKIFDPKHAAHMHRHKNTKP